MFVPIRNFGKFGVIHDTVGETLPIGAWTDARNVRFTGREFEKMLEPALETAFTPDGGMVKQGWSDGTSTYIAMATQTQIYFLRSDGPDSDDKDWVLAGSGYSDEGQWQAFSWGDTCIFNNGIDPPQIFNNGTLQFEDLPKWGLISTAADIANGSDPSKDTKASCKVLLPYKNFLVALGVSENGLYQPNTVWWSDSTALAGLATSISGGGPPDWDYESPASLSGKTEMGTGDGPIRWGAQLNENLIVYTDSSASALTFVGGTFVMSTRRLFNKGCAGLHLAVEFNNRHFVVARDQLYVHDGSTVSLIAKDRVEEEFFRRAGKGGRFGGGDIDYTSMQLVKNPDRKEIYLKFGRISYPEASLDVLGTVIHRFDFEDDLAGGISARLASYRENILLMSNDKIAISDDGGDTFVEKSLPYGNSVTGAVYHPDGAWFVQCTFANGTNGRVYRTTDGGDSWDLLVPGYLSQYATDTIMIDNSNRLCFTVNAGTEVYVTAGFLVRFDDPMNDLNYSSRVALPYRFLDGMRAIEGGYAISVAPEVNAGPHHILVVDEDLDSGYSGVEYATDHQNWSSDGSPLSTSVDPVESIYIQGSIRLTPETDPGDPPYNYTSTYLFTNGTSVPLPEVSSGYDGDDLWETRVNTGVDYNLWVGMRETQTDEWVLAASFGGTEFSVIGTLRMPTVPALNSRFWISWLSTGFWVAHYVEEDTGQMVTVKFEVPLFGQTEALVYNFEDDNYTWMDASIDDDAVLNPVAWFDYSFDPGWLTRWDSDNLSGLSWDDFLSGQEPWRGSGFARWSDFASEGTEKNMYWNTPDGVYKGDSAISTSGAKSYFIERLQIDLDDLNAKWTTNLVKHLKQFVFHLQTPSSVDSPNTFDITAGWSQNLMDQPVWVTTGAVELNTTANNGAYKWDVRTSGRYLSLRMDFDATAEIRMTGADIDVEPHYGR